MDLEQRSAVLFGRYQALTMYAAIAGLPKPEFTTGQLAQLTAYPVSQCSKELARLVSLHVVRTTSRRGDHERLPSPFWEAVSMLVDEWRSTETPAPASEPPSAHPGLPPSAS